MASNDPLWPCIYKIVLYYFYKPALCSQVLYTSRADLPYSVFMNTYCRARYCFFNAYIYPGAVFLNAYISDRYCIIKVCSWVRYQSKTKEIIFHGEYEFILQCLIHVVWKSFRHPFSPLFCVGLVKDYLMQSDQYLKSLHVFIKSTVWVSKSWMSSKSMAIRSTNIYDVCLIAAYVYLVL